LSPPNARALAGASPAPNPGTRQIFTGNGYAVHSAWNADNEAGDIAVIRLSTPVCGGTSMTSIATGAILTFDPNTFEIFCGDPTDIDVSADEEGQTCTDSSFGEISGDTSVSYYQDFVDAALRPAFQFNYVPEPASTHWLLESWWGLDCAGARKAERDYNSKRGALSAPFFNQRSMMVIAGIVVAVVMMMMVVMTAVMPIAIVAAGDRIAGQAAQNRTADRADSTMRGHAADDCTAASA